jgi:ATP synthase subunit K
MSDIPVLARFLAMGTLVGVMGGFILPSPWSRSAGPPPAQVSRSSPQMMQLARDEHDVIANMVKAQIAAEQQPTARTALRGSGNRDRTAAGGRKQVAVR